MAYDFTTLSPDDFENLIADLFSREWKSRVEAFKAGKDAGIDLRNSRVLAGKKPTIIQCKRYAPNKLPELRRAVTQEMRKLDRIKPGRYVLATSVPLSPANKDELIRLLAPWCNSPGDIYGASEINGLLRDHPEVERAHFKLWVSSTAILERILHSRIFNVTQATLESTKDYMSRIVMHEGFNRALEMLCQEHHVLIVGRAWKVDHVTPAAEIQTLLEIESKVGIDDARFTELQSRTTTAAGWAILASGVFTDYHTLADLSRLNDWIQKRSRWPAKIKAQSKRTFREIVNQLVSDNEEVWASSISTLRALAGMISSKKSPLSEEEKEAFSGAATAIVDTIEDNVRDPDDIYSEQRELQRLEEMCNINLQKQDTKLARLAERWAEWRDDEGQPDPDEDTTSRDPEDAFDVDALFAGLLDR